MERITLNIIPKGITPVCHASQFDIGRVIRCDIMDNLQGYVFSDETVELRVCKPDNNIVTASVDVVSGDTFVLIETTEQMTACDGVNKCELRITKGDVRIGSLNFDMKVEVDPLKDGVESETVIHNLESMVDEMVAEDVAEQYDSANVIFDEEPTENHGIGYTVTSEGIKTAIDNAFDYDNTASGSLVHIEDGADNIPVKSLVSEIVAVESGSGEKSPTNPYSISGFDSGVITRCGKNLFAGAVVSSDIEQNGTIVSKSSAYWRSNKIPIGSNKKITFSIFSNPNYATGSFNYRAFDSSGVWVADETFFSGIGTTPINKTVTLADNVAYLYIRGYQSGGASGITNSQIQLEIGDTATTFEEYNGNAYTFTFGQTIYGGHFDNKGNLVVTHGFVDLGDLEWSYNSGLTLFLTTISGIKTGLNDISKLITCSSYATTNYAGFNSITNLHIGTGSASGLSTDRIAIMDTDYSDANAFKTAMSGHCVVYELANPITLAITSQDIPTLLGENNIFSNCGDVEVNYYTSKSNDILEFVDSEIGKKNGTNIPIEENSQDSIKDYVDNGLSGKADTGDLNDKQDKNVLNIVKHYDSGTSSDAIADIITEYGKVNMVFAFDVPLGYFTGCLTFANDNMGSGFIVLSTTGRFWVVSYVSGTITLTELT